MTGSGSHREKRTWIVIDVDSQIEKSYWRPAASDDSVATSDAMHQWVCSTATAVIEAIRCPPSYLFSILEQETHKGAKIWQ